MSLFNRFREFFGGASKHDGEYSKKLLGTKEYYPFSEWRKSYDLGLEQYTEKNCNRIQKVFDNLITELIHLGEAASEERKVEVFKKAVLATNKINNEIEDLIETGEREDLSELINKISFACGINPINYGDGEGLASEWREW